MVEDSTKDVSKINSAINHLESNILTLRDGGKVASIDLMPLQVEFLDDWNNVYQKWISFKTIIANNIIEPSDKTIGSIDKLTLRYVRNRSTIFSKFIKHISYKIG